MTNEQIKNSFHILPIKERAAVALHLSGFTPRQIGEAFGLTVVEGGRLRDRGLKRLDFRMRQAL